MDNHHLNWVNTGKSSINGPLHPSPWIPAVSSLLVRLRSNVAWCRASGFSLMHQGFSKWPIRSKILARHRFQWGEAVVPVVGPLAVLHSDAPCLLLACWWSYKRLVFCGLRTSWSIWFLGNSREIWTLTWRRFDLAFNFDLICVGPNLELANWGRSGESCKIITQHACRKTDMTSPHCPR